MDMSRKLGDLVKKARTEKGLTQAALAEKVDGLTASDVSKIERGERNRHRMCSSRWRRPSA